MTLNALDHDLNFNKASPVMLPCPVCGGDKKSRVKAGEPCGACNDAGKVTDKHQRIRQSLAAT
jgi:reverse gyrase